jgi:hypothetical protein
MITVVMLDLTTACNRHCQNCCCKIPTRRPVHYPWEYFEHVASFAHGIERIDVTGGEPTCHPQFRGFVPKLRALFGCRLLTLETNCFRIREYADLLPRFDFVRYGRYADNSAEVAWLKANHRDVRWNNLGNCVETRDPVDENGHVSIERRGSGMLCHLESRAHVAYTGGKFYPCRLGPAVDGAVGIEPCADWREKVVQLPIPCGNCYFSPDVGLANDGPPRAA